MKYRLAIFGFCAARRPGRSWRISAYPGEMFSNPEEILEKVG